MCEPGFVLLYSLNKKVKIRIKTLFRQLKREKGRHIATSNIHKRIAEQQQTVQYAGTVMLGEPIQNIQVQK